MDVRLATYLHTSILTKLLFLAISIHAVYAIHLSFRRWGIWGNKGKIILALGYAVFLMFFLFVEVFYGRLSKLGGSNIPNASKPSSQNTQ